MRLLLAMLVGLSMWRVAATQALPEYPADIGYSSPEAALTALPSKPGVVITHRAGWTVIQDKNEDALWTIAEPGNPAYPSAIKRFLVTENSIVSLKMKVLCGASKASCDDMVRQFQELNSNIVKAVQ